MFDMMRHCKAVGRRARIITYNLNPKSRKGKIEMRETERTKAQLNEALSEFMKANQRALLEGVLDILEEKNEMYKKILTNGYDIFMQTRGERWYKIYNQRNKIWLKLLLIDSLEREIIEKYY